MVYNISIQVPETTTASLVHTTMHGSDDDGVLEVRHLRPSPVTWLLKH